MSAPDAQAGAELVGTQLITLDPEKYVTAVFATFRDQLVQAKADAAAVTVIDVTTAAGMKVAVQHRAALRTIRVEAEKARKQRKAPILEIGRLLDSRYKALEDEITPIEDRFDSAIKAEEQRKEHERLARERAEAERVERIKASIREMRGALIDVAGRSSAVIEAKIRELVAVEITAENTAEFQAEAEAAREQTLAKLRDMQAAAVAQEAEAERLKAERAALERERAEQEQREREARERADAETRQREEAEAARRRELEEQERQSRERIEAQEREARERQEAEDRRLREERERVAAEARALEDRQRQERLAQEERERQARLETEQRKREERERIEAEEREQQRRELELADIREALAKLRERVSDVAEFAWYAKAYDAATKPKAPRRRAAATA